MEIQKQPQVKKSDGIGRLFIDPASISSGWAYFKGLELVSHGTISTNAKSSIFDRLSSIWVGYRHLDFSGPIQEVHIEKLPRRCHHYTMWSVGVIGHALTRLTLNIKDDVPVKSWQKHANWQRESDVWKRLGYSSEDEFAAICMGYWYIGGLS